jgi:hypothetical protein
VSTIASAGMKARPIAKCPRSPRTNSCLIPRLGLKTVNDVAEGWTFVLNGVSSVSVVMRSTRAPSANYESTQYVPASGMVQVGSYFLAGRDDLLLGNQIDARRSFSIAGRAVSVVAGYLYQNQDQDRYTGGVIPNQNRLVDLLNPAPIFDPGFPLVFDRNPGDGRFRQPDVPPDDRPHWRGVSADRPDLVLCQP